MDENKFISRHEPRIKLDLDVFIKTAGPENKDDLIKGKILDFSKSGLMIKTGKVFELNTELELHFVLLHKPIKIMASVQWLSNNDRDKLPTMGLRISILTKEDEETLSDFFDSINYYGWFY